MPTDRAQDERPMPKVSSGCFRCKVTPQEVTHWRVVVSPTGKAHRGDFGGSTACGIDETGERWWRPL